MLVIKYLSTSRVAAAVFYHKLKVNLHFNCNRLGLKNFQNKNSSNEVTKVVSKYLKIIIINKWIK